jgi:hypothetical protein
LGQGVIGRRTNIGRQHAEQIEANGHPVQASPPLRLVMTKAMPTTIPKSMPTAWVEVLAISSPGEYRFGMERCFLLNTNHHKFYINYL